MELIYLLSTSTVWLLVTVGLVSLMIGSFLNVIISRLPVMLEREWKHECNEFLGNTDSTPADTSTFNLAVPRSQCPKCGHQITALENIPVISYLFMRGKCSNCRTSISLQYPLIEITTAVLSMLIAAKYGFSKETLALLLMTWTLITLFMIDAQTMLLPDNIVLPLLWLGILLNMNGFFTSLESSVIGAVAGYLILWSLFHGFKLMTGKEGMGYGDFKLLAALGAWGGWEILPFVVFASSAFGAVFGISLMLIKNQKESQPMPFGPWLAMAGFVALVWHTEVVDYTRNFLMV
uniref:Prepilin leader peptidase/N-methyltransferase n=1 Tax=uncultured Thiotrichaceae bacterium TaxID=298394 RepID=A0A6S6U856_9GAMM|nr:MAG: Leader peptidase (Prepilin peptidase) (EC / N-methyltransferase (EC [uncultured Thiotrichaceae bacterium]